MIKSTFKQKSGLDILAAILKYCEPNTNRNIIKGLKRDMPAVAAELSKRILTFEDLAFADKEGLRHLLRLISIRDLATSLKGAPTPVLKTLAEAMSQRALEDLKEEISFLGALKSSEVLAARDRIMVVVAEMLQKKQLFIDKRDDSMIL